MDVVANSFRVFTMYFVNVAAALRWKCACALRMLLPAAGGIYAGKRQEIDHAEALWRSIVGRQRW